jgi:hypothetical protein
MVPLMSLWMPILLSAVAVFIASSIIHMVLGYHKSDFSRMPNEAAATDALRALNLAPGDYMLPLPSSAAAMKDPAFIERITKGPNLFLTVFPPTNGPPNMNKQLGQWFVYCAVVALFSAYVAGRTLAPGAEYLAVFRVAGTVAFTSFALAQWQHVVWYHRSVRTTLTATFDSLIYALLTGGVFGWLWPM